jgi:hypothetical protein
MKHLRTINRKAGLLAQYLESPPAGESQTSEAGGDVVALQQGPPQQPPGPHFPLGCSLQFDPGWETDSNGGTAGLCQPVERDLFDCHTGCYWPAQVPDQLNHAPDWTSKCAAAQKDWRKIDLIFP